MGKYGAAREATDDNIKRRMWISYWMNKTTDTHSENVIVIAFPWQTMVSVTLLNGTFIRSLPVSF